LTLHKKAGFPLRARQLAEVQAKKFLAAGEVQPFPFMSREFSEFTNIDERRQHEGDVSGQAENPLE